MDIALIVAFLITLIAATLRVATPLVLGTVGEIINERSGVLNLGIEGIMFLGAFVGFAVAAQSEAAGVSAYLWVGLAAAVLVGVLVGLLMGVFAVSLGVNQHVAGLGITLLCTSLALFSFRLVFGSSSVLPSVDPFPAAQLLERRASPRADLRTISADLSGVPGGGAAGVVAPVPDALRPQPAHGGRESRGRRRRRRERGADSLRWRWRWAAR